MNDGRTELLIPKVIFVGLNLIPVAMGLYKLAVLDHCMRGTCCAVLCCAVQGYKHFMLKEVMEQPRVLKDCMRGTCCAVLCCAVLCCRCAVLFRATSTSC